MEFQSLGCDLEPEGINWHLGDGIHPAGRVWSGRVRGRRVCRPAAEGGGAAARRARRGKTRAVTDDDARGGEGGGG